MQPDGWVVTIGTSLRLVIKQGWGLDLGGGHFEGGFGHTKTEMTPSSMGCRTIHWKQRISRGFWRGKSGACFLLGGGCNAFNSNDNHITYLQQYFYDFCMVCAFERAQSQALDRCGDIQLGYCTI
jgi:hypothetical protein